MTATDLVLAELVKSGRSPNLQAFYLTVFWGEVGDTIPAANGGGGPVVDPWRTEYGYGLYTGDLTTFPSWTAWPGIKLSSGLVSSALGPAQITHTTWDSWSALPGSTTDFNPPGQITCALVGAVSRYQSLTGGRDLDSDLQAGLLGQIQTKLLPTWPGGMANFPKQFPKALAMITSPPVVVPPPAPPPPPAAETVTMTLTDQAGRTSGPISVTLKSSVAALVAAMIILASNSTDDTTTIFPSLPVAAQQAKGICGDRDLRWLLSPSPCLTTGNEDEKPQARPGMGSADHLQWLDLSPVGLHCFVAQLEASPEESAIKLESWHSTEDKRRWKIVRTDNYTDVAGEIITADEETGEACLHVAGENKTLSFGPRGIRIIGRGR